MGLYTVLKKADQYISSFLMHAVMIKLTLPNQNSFDFWPLEGALHQDRSVPVLKNSRQ